MNCYRCGVELTNLNKSPEHIIQRAIGGTIVSWDILCHDCNLWFGREVDPAFTRFTSYLYRMILQARPTSRVSDSLTGITESGEEVRFGPNMEMETRVQLDMPDGKIITFTASPAEAEKKAIKKLTELRGRYKQIDPQRMIANAKRGEVRLEELIYLTNHNTKHSITGGPDFFRGIKKIAINFYLSKGHAQKYIQDVINQVKEGRPASRKISTFYYAHPAHKLGTQEISHLIKLVGNPELGILYCYVELFNINHALILLNRYYYGPSIDEQYCYDVLSGSTLNKSISLPFDNRELLLRIFDYDWETNLQAEIAYRRTRRILEDLLRAKGFIK